MENNINDKNIIKSTIKAFHLLEILVEHGKLNISTLSKLTGFTKSTTQRIVNTLRHLKYIHQDMTTYEYYPSIKLYELGINVVDNISIKNIAKPHLLKLYNEVDETINIGVLDNDSIIYLDKIVSKSPIRVELEIGIKVPIYCSALGKTIAAFNDEVVLFGNEYVNYTEHTISSDEELQKHLAQVKKQGYAIDNEEYVIGLICIGVPILNSKGNAIASISISKPTSRFQEDDISNYFLLLKECATNIQNELY